MYMYDHTCIEDPLNMFFIREPNFSICPVGTTFIPYIPLIPHPSTAGVLKVFSTISLGLGPSAKILEADLVIKVLNVLGDLGTKCFIQKYSNPTKITQETLNSGIWLLGKYDKGNGNHFSIATLSL